MNCKKTLKITALIWMLIGLPNAVWAADFLQTSRQFLSLDDASVEQNEDYLSQSDQFYTEGDYTEKEYAEILFIRGNIYARLKDNENALVNYSAALESGNLTPILRAETLKLRGLLYYTSTVYSESKSDFISALNILSGNAELQYYLANSYFGLFEFETALKQYDLALEGMANNRFLAYYGKASVYHQQQNFEKSRENLIKSLAIKSDFTPALNLLAEINGDATQANPADISVSTANTNPDNAEQTAAEIYNQLLEQAFAAQQQGDGAKKLSIKLDLNAKPIATASNAKPQPESTVTLRKTTTGQQVLAIQSIIDQDNPPKRLDDLLNVEPETKTKTIAPKTNAPQTNIRVLGYFLQLSSHDDEIGAQNYYAELLNKHKLLLANRPHRVIPYTNDQNLTSFQLLVSGFDSYKQANSLCKFIKAQNSDCVVKPIK